MRGELMSHISRRLAAGADVQPDGSTFFRVWAPSPREVCLVIHRPSGQDVELPMKADGDGYFAARVPDACPGTRYRYRLDGKLFADPVSRFQPEGAFGPSEVVDPARYQWRNRAWRGLSIEGQVMYELHLGTFTPEGTWHAAAAKLPEIKAIGVTAVEVMPVAEFPGRFGWGYDGVFLYAPCQLYGTPDDFRSFVDSAHEIGLGVILDVVYNHLGPSGCVHKAFAEAYFTRKYENEWGEALNFDGPDAAPVRDHFVQNAGYWIDEFHLDGLRLDALQGIKDASPNHIVATITTAAREAARDRSIIIVAENEQQQGFAVHPPEEGGYGVDAVWNDDFHHSAHVVLTGRREAYFSDHQGAPQEFISAAKYGYLFQGQRYAWQRQRRGTPSAGLPPAAFVNYIENHDQVANTGDGSRIHEYASPGRYRAMTALLLLLPGTPLLFQGQEFASSSPFLYFADHEGDLAAAVHKGRAEFMRQFPSCNAPDAKGRVPAPHDPATFERCKLRWTERDFHVCALRLHQDLLRMRHDDGVFARQQPGALDGAVLAAEAFALRFQSAIPDEERLLLINFGADLVAGAFPEPLVAPPSRQHVWRMRWSSEDPAYGGTGAGDVVTEEGWRIPGHSATVLAPLSGE
jgi:maltooligosyltrehalose trehalohydrolase